MKLTTVFLLIGCLHLSAASYSQTITLEAREYSLKDVFSVIQKQTDYHIVYNVRFLKGSKPVSISANQMPLEAFLTEVLNDQYLTYEIRENTILIGLVEQRLRPNPRPMITEAFQERIISGTVTDEQDNPLVGVTVTAKGLKAAVITNEQGAYQLQVPQNTNMLVFTMIGFSSVEQEIGGRTTIDVSLVASQSDLDEVVVVGYGTQKKVNLTGAVAQIGGDKLENRSVTNISQALQGQVANLNITSAGGGSPGSAPSMNIRGYTGLGTSAAPLVVIDGIQGGDLNSINMNDVESVSVLKDAASAAIYGSSAPYGVILITTKKGKEGKPVITYGNNFGFAQPINLPELMSSLETANFFNEAAENSGNPKIVGDEQLQRIVDYLEGRLTDETVVNPAAGVDGWLAGNANNDWFKIFLRDYAFNQQHNLGVSGSASKVNYYIGMGHLQQGGVYTNLDDEFKRSNIRVNLSSDITNWLTVNARSAYSRVNKSDLSKSYEGSFGNIMHFIARTMPWSPRIYPNGETELITSKLFPEGGKTKTTTDNTTLTGELVVRPLEGWNITANYTFDGVYQRLSDHYKGLYHNNAPSGETLPYTGFPNAFTRTSGFNEHHTINAYTSYEKQLDDHYFNILAGFTQELYDNLSISSRNNYLYSDELPSLSLTYGSAVSATDAASQLAIRGGFGRVNYNFNEKYLVELNGRYDGTSRFLKDVRYHFYPGASVAWVLSKEDFFSKASNAVNLFKIRASYGKLGDQSFTSNYYPFYPSLGVISPSASNYFFGNVRESAISNSALVNPSLSWVTVSTIDFGADLAFLSNRLNVSFDWYRRSLDNYVGPSEQLPAILGSAAPQTNSAAMETKGIDVTIGWQQLKREKWGYGVNAVFSDYKSKVTRYPNPNGIITSWYVGQEIGEIWGYETHGLFQSEAEIESAPSQERLYSRWTPGDVRYKDLNADGEIDWGDNTLDSPGDRRVIGNTTPRFSFGVNANVQYENFDLTLFLQGVGKRDAAPDQASHVSNYFWGVTGDQVQSTGFIQQRDRWSESNPDGYYPKFYMTHPEMIKNKQTQTRYLMNASYLRVKNVQIGYSLPSSILQHVSMQKLRLFANVENLATMTKYIKTMDPEFSNTQGFAIGPDGKVYPLQRVWAFGLQVTF